MLDNDQYTADEAHDLASSQVAAFMGSIAYAKLHKIWAARCNGLHDLLLRGRGDTYNDVVANRAKLSAYEEIMRDFQRLKGDDL